MQLNFNSVLIVNKSERLEMDNAIHLKVLLVTILWKIAFVSGKYVPQAEETEYKASYDAYESPPHPFHFGYDVLDEHGNKQQRQEQGDQHGTVKGSYGYTDAHGVYRQVDYVADHTGFRAVVQSNEPGLSNEDPADVKLTAKPPPPHIFEQQLTKSHGYSDPKLYHKTAGKPVYRETSY